MKELQGFLKLGVHRDRSPSAAFCDALSKQDLIAYSRIAPEDHFPLEPAISQARIPALKLRRTITLFRSA